MTTEEVEAFIDRLYAATAEGDWDTVGAMVTDDLLITEAAGLPMAGEYRGKNALRDLFVQVFDTLSVAGLDRGQTVVGGDHAGSFVTMRFTGEGLAPAELFEMFRFRDGKVCEIKPYYFDPAPVLAAAAAKQAA